MSYDYRIVGSDRISTDNLNALFKQFDWQMFRGDSQSDYFSFGKNSDTPINCDIARIDAEDVEEALAQVTLAPEWQYVLSVPLTMTKSEQTKAGKFAIGLAEIIRGAAFDPQKDKILYPKGIKQRYIADLTQERTDVIAIDWILPLQRINEDVLRQFLKLIVKILPEALPIRYGNREPLSHSLRDGKGKKASSEAIDQFIHFAMELKQEEDALFWKAERPCFLGKISYGCKSYSLGKEDAICTMITINFDARACCQDSRWIRILEKLFLQVAHQLPAFYAMAYVDQNIGVSKNNTLWFNGREKTYPLPYYHWWMGIPGYPMWMSWFGKPYMEIVEEVLHGYPYCKMENGFYLNTGLEQPMTMDMAELHFPKLPKQLLCVREYGLNPNGSVSEYKYEDVPAEVIPDIRQI